GVVLVGTLLYIFFRYWSGIYRLFPTHWSFNTLFTGTLESTERFSSYITKKYMTGYLRDYLIYIFLFLIITVGGTFIASEAFQFDMTNDANIRAYEWIIMIVMVIAGISILFAKSRLIAILLNSVLGYSVAIFFVVFRAPDLALTQLVVETVSTALFLSCFYFLPEWEKAKTTKKNKLVNLIISISVGLIFVLVALSVKSGKLFTSISSFFENAYELAGGRNIVNVILGDFRAFDTMLEVVVLLIGGL